MNYRIIHSPSAGTLNVLFHRSGRKMELSQFGAVGLVQGRLIDMVYAVDIAEKAAGVSVDDIRGSCPQNMILIAIYGDSASVEEAIQEIKEKIGDK